MADRREAKNDAVEEADASRPDVPNQLEEFRQDIAKTIRDTFPWLFRLTVFVALALIALVWLGFGLGRTMDATVLAASVQVAFGMVIGFVCVYLGLMMTWFGIDAAFTLKGSASASGGKLEGALQSASPGLLFALAGIILIGVSLHKRIEYSEQGFKPAGFTRMGSDVEEPAVQPKAPAGGIINVIEPSD
jgi:hypothetical protein